MKKTFLVFVILFLLISLIPVNCFAEDFDLGTYPYDLKEYVLVIWSDYGEHGYYNVLTSSEKFYFDKSISNSTFFNLDGYAEVSWSSYGTKYNTWGPGKSNVIVEEGDTRVSEILYASVFYSNYDVFDKDGNVFFNRNDIEFWANVNFVTPPSGVHDTLSEMIFTVNTEFNKLLTPDEIKSIDYKFYINGEKKNILKKLNEAFLPLSVKDRTSHILSFEIIVPIGENFCEIIYYNDEGIEIGYGSVEFERLAGFIDADGDGKDDRTGRTYGIRRLSDDIDSTIDKPIKPDDDANAIDWLIYLGEYVGYIFEVLLNSISNFAKNVVSGVGSVLGLAEPMFSFVNQFFSSMPVEIRTAIIAMFSVSVFLVIMKMIRG